MLRLKKQSKRDDTYLALPTAEPVTLYKLPEENLPYACQCPLCGGVFDIPEGALYKLEEDDYADIDSEAEPIGPAMERASDRDTEREPEFENSTELENNPPSTPEEG